MKLRFPSGYVPFPPICLLLCLSAARAQRPAEAPSAQGLMQEGSAALRSGNLSAAQTAFLAATNRAPTSAEAFLGLGLVLLREGLAKQATVALEKASSLDSHLAGPHLFLGISEFQLGQVPEAIASLRAELALDPDNIEAATWLTLVLLSADRAGEAAPIADHAVALKSSDPQLLYLQAKAHGLIVKKALDKLYQLDPDSSFVHQATAESLDASGDVLKSVAEYQAAVRKEPKNPDLLESLGDEQQKAGHVEAAASAFEQELTLNPNSGAALYALGRLDVERGQPMEGIKLLRRAQRANANAPATAYYLGLALAETGRAEEAEHWLRVSLSPESPGFVQQGAWYQLARVYQKMNRPAEAKDALAHLKSVLDEQNRAKETTAKAARSQSPGAPTSQTEPQP